ncbi:hypothetical protein [Salinibacter ruber]|uniref:Uncharacterized protein n=1 Tax=Salinibacter ruber TaxID=146919 RepID=A0A9X2Q7C6_9BACT|nr:hypothetical protein [Salinibacter ruber]MCS3661784.1 hypothetical protein [Salinibacter ruber]MCS3711555.1 hypothetical protein [Salinibacter ruber]
MKFFVEIDGPKHLIVHTNDEFVNEQIRAAARSITGMCPVAETTHGVQIATNGHSAQARTDLLDHFRDDPYITATEGHVA